MGVSLFLGVFLIDFFASFVLMCAPLSPVGVQLFE